MPSKNEPVFDLEETFKRILEQPDVVIPADEIPEGSEFTEKQRAILQAVLEAEMPTPERIERDAKNAARNAELDLARQEKLARRKERQAKQGKRRRRG